MNRNTCYAQLVTALLSILISATYAMLPLLTCLQYHSQYARNLKASGLIPSKAFLGGHDLAYSDRALIDLTRYEHFFKLYPDLRSRFEKTFFKRFDSPKQFRDSVKKTFRKIGVKKYRILFVSDPDDLEEINKLIAELDLESAKEFKLLGNGDIVPSDVFFNLITQKQILIMGDLHDIDHLTALHHLPSQEGYHAAAKLISDATKRRDTILAMQKIKTTEKDQRVLNDAMELVHTSRLLSEGHLWYTTNETMLVLNSKTRSVVHLGGLPHRSGAYHGGFQYVYPSGRGENVANLPTHYTRPRPTPASPFNRRYQKLDFIASLLPLVNTAERMKLKSFLENSKALSEKLDLLQVQTLSRRSQAAGPQSSLVITKQDTPRYIKNWDLFDQALFKYIEQDPDLKWYYLEGGEQVFNKAIQELAQNYLDQAQQLLQNISD